MKTTNLIRTGILLFLCVGCENGIRRVSNGTVLETREGTLLKPGDYYHLTDNPRMLWQVRYVQITVKKVLTKTDKSQQKTTINVGIDVHIPADKVTKEIVNRVQKKNILDSDLAAMIQARADQEEWTVFEEMERRGRAEEPVLRSSTVKRQVSLFEIMPELLL